MSIDEVSDDVDDRFSGGSEVVEMTECGLVGDVEEQTLVVVDLLHVCDQRLECSAYESDVFVLYTQSDTIYRSLKKSEHEAILKETFAGIGIAEGKYDVRLRGKQSDDFNRSVEEIKNTFQGVKIDIK